MFTKNFKNVLILTVVFMVSLSVNLQAQDFVFDANPFIYALKDSFVVELEATPTGDSINVGFTLLKSDEPAQFDDNAVLVRFNEKGSIDARNGDTYVGDLDVPYSAGETYAIKVTGNVKTSTYNVFVTPPGGAESQVATNFSFRTAQVGVDMLKNWGKFYQEGADNIDVNNVQITFTSTDEFLFYSFPLEGGLITDKFMVEYDAVPMADSINFGFTLLKTDSPTEFNDNAVLVRFNGDGFCDARNGNSYERIADVPYSAGESYHIKVIGQIDTTAGSSGTYSVWVTPPGGTETIIAEHFKYRSAQANVDTLKNWGYFVNPQEGYAVISKVTLPITWLYYSFPLQGGPAPLTDNFIVEYDAVPLGDNINFGFTLLKTDYPLAFDDNAVLVRFNADGFCDARNGNSYERVADVPYEAGEKYHIKVCGKIDTTSESSGKYSVWVTPPEGCETLVADNFNFRTALANVDTLYNWGYFMHPNEGAASITNVTMPDISYNGVPLIPTLTDTMVALCDTFVVEYDAIPRSDTVNFVFALSKTATPTQFDDFAVLVRFNESGVCDARNGGSYERTVDVPYERDKRYHFKVAGKVNPTDGGKYNVWVTPEDGVETLIAENFGFRTAQTNVDTLFCYGSAIQNPGQWTDGGYATYYNVYLSYANNTPNLWDEWYLQSVPLEVTLKDSFVVEADGIAGADSIDCGFSILNCEKPGEFNDLACLIRFTAKGVFDARNGDKYEKIVEVPYEKHKKYHIKVAGNVSNSTYSVWITDPLGTETLIAENFQYRTAQIGVECLRYWGRFFSPTSGYAEFNNITVESLGAGTGVNSEINLVKTFKLEQNYPNPFNPTTTISYSLPKNSHVSIDVYNILGEHVVSLVDRNLTVGDYSVKWNAVDKYGLKVANGIYIYQIIAGDFTQHRKMLLLK